MKKNDDRSKLLRAGFAVFFALLFVLLVLSSAFSLAWYVIVIADLIITALVLLFMSLHLRIERLERKVDYLSDKLYSLEHKDND